MVARAEEADLIIWEHASAGRRRLGLGKQDAVLPDAVKHWKLTRIRPGLDILGKPQ
jgi:hypothetical protein